MNNSSETDSHSDQDATEDAEKVGRRLHAMRMSHGLTIGRLAELSNVPASTISKIENGHLRPSLVNAINLAQALDENLGFLIGRYRDPHRTQVVVRALSRQTIHYKEMGLALQDLSGAFVPGVLEARLGVLAPGASSGTHAMSHAGEELCYVISGKICYQVEGQEVVLTSGEYLQLKSETPHSWKSTSTKETTVLWVFSDGLSF